MLERRKRVFITFIFSALFVAGSATVLAAEAKAPIPNGFGKYITYMSIGIYDENDPDYVAPTGEDFQRQVMDRTDAEIETHRDAARAYFSQRFGLDTADPRLNGRILFFGYWVDPRQELRAYAYSGANVQSDGWKVDDGGYMLLVTDPNGVVLGGDFAGRFVGGNTAFVYGDYRINRKYENRFTGEVTTEYDFVTYRSNLPGTVDDNGVTMINCFVNHPIWGQGRVEGFIAPPESLEGGLSQAHIRGTLTFPNYGQFLDQSATISTTPTPDGTTKFLAYMATGIWDPSDSSYNPPSGMEYLQNIVGMSEAEIDQERTDALNFFKDRFGIDLEDPSMQSRIILENFLIDPRWNLRAYYMSGERIPPQGWPFYDGGFRAIVLDPAGIVLGGEFAGQVAPAGSAAIYGRVTLPLQNTGPLFKKGRDEIFTFNYTTRFVVSPSQDGFAPYLCPAYNEDYGFGTVDGLFRVPMTLPDGRIEAHVRGIISFFGE